MGENGVRVIGYLNDAGDFFCMACSNGRDGVTSKVRIHAKQVCKKCGRTIINHRKNARREMHITNGLMAVPMAGVLLYLLIRGVFLK